MTVRVSAVVVNFDQETFLRACLASLDVALSRVEGACETIVVDNGSSDGSVVMVRADFPDARLIELSENTGFAGGVDTGIRAARGEWILCINNDATVAREAVVELLEVAGSSGDDVGAVAARMVFADQPDIINSAGIEVDRLGVASDRLLGEPVTASERAAVEVFGTSAGAALYRRSMLDVVPFERSFFAYYEDVDVAWRARMRGWRCMYAPRAVVHHHHSATARHGSPLKYYWSGKNRVRVLARNATRSQLLRYGVLMLAFDLAYIGVVLVVDRSTAPVRGRFAALRLWQEDRRSGAAQRREVDLAPFLGVRASYRRFRGSPQSNGLHVRDRRDS